MKFVKKGSLEFVVDDKSIPLDQLICLLSAGGIPDDLEIRVFDGSERLVDLLISENDDGFGIQFQKCKDIDSDLWDDLYGIFIVFRVCRNLKRWKNLPEFLISGLGWRLGDKIEG